MANQYLIGKLHILIDCNFVQLLCEGQSGAEFDSQKSVSFNLPKYAAANILW